MAKVRFPYQTLIDPGAQGNFEFLETRLGGNYTSAPGKVTVSDADFAAPFDGMTAVHYDTTAAKTYLSVRANGIWHVMAGPV
jgi:hypothetical protein